MGKLTVSAFQKHETGKAATCIKIKSLTFDKILQRLKTPLLEDCPLLLAVLCFFHVDRQTPGSEWTETCQPPSLLDTAP